MALTKPLQAPLPADVVQVVVPAVPGVQNDPIVLLADGTIGTLLYDSVAGSYAFRAETTAVGATAIHVGSFDADRRADLIAVDGSATLRLFATVDATGAHGGDLAERGTLTLPRAPELVLVDNTVLDRFSEVVVVLSPAPGSDARVVQTYPVSRANGTGAASFVGGASSATTFPTRLVSLAAGNFTGRHRNNLDRRKWLVGGTADGRVLTARNGEAQAIELPPGLGAIGSGAIEVVVADFSNDYLPDIVAYERGSKTIAVFRCKPDASEAWRFPNPGAYEFQGAGEFDSPAVVTIPEPLSALTAARVDNDPYHDLLLLSADGERVHVVLTRGSQIGN